MSQEIDSKDMTIAVVGLGYVGLPLFCQLSTSFPVIGYDVDIKRVEEIKRELIPKTLLPTSNYVMPYHVTR